MAVTAQEGKQRLEGACFCQLSNPCLFLVLFDKISRFMCNLTLAYQYRQHWLKKVCNEAGVKPFGFHGIRHLFASILAAQNVPLVEIQYMLRHTSLATTQRYIHRLKKENREVLAALPGLTASETKSTSNVHQQALGV